MDELRGVCLALVNAERARRSLPALALDAAYTVACQAQSDGVLALAPPPACLEALHAAGLLHTVLSAQVDAEFAPHMLYVRNDDKPGFIGQFGSLLGEKGINIATFNLGRTGPGGDAICFVAVDEAISDDTLAAIGKIPMVKRARRLAF